MCCYGKALTRNVKRIRSRWWAPSASSSGPILIPGSRWTSRTARASSSIGASNYSPNNLGRQGWRSCALKPGDKATVVISPPRNGDKGGLFVSATLPNGKVLGDGVPSRPAPAAAGESKPEQPTP